jgi:hypothetical protein
MSMILQGHSYFTTIHKLSKTLYRDRSGHAGGSGGDIELGVGAVRGAADDIAGNRRRSGWGGGVRPQERSINYHKLVTISHSSWIRLQGVRSKQLSQ